MSSSAAAAERQVSLGCGRWTSAVDRLIHFAVCNEARSSRRNQIKHIICSELGRVEGRLKQIMHKDHLPLDMDVMCNALLIGAVKKDKCV